MHVCHATRGDILASRVRLCLVAGGQLDAEVIDEDAYYVLHPDNPKATLIPALKAAHVERKPSGRNTAGQLA